MTLFSVFCRETADPADRLPRLVGDRFAWSAALFPPVYMLVHHLWWSFAGFFLLLAALAGLSLWLGPDATIWAYMLLAVLFGFEAPNLVRRRLVRRGFRHVSERFGADGDMVAVHWLQARGPNS